MLSTSLRLRRLIFVTGKGGVGKTTIAAGLARTLANEGRRVLLCSVDERSDLADAFNVAPLNFRPTVVDDHLSLMAMDTEASLREYLKIYLKLPMVGRIGPIAAAFDFVATAAPGVREILTIGKLCYEVRERHYDSVIVDSPSSGHITGYLAAPQALQQLIRVGLIRNQTDWMLKLLSDESTTGVVLVTTAEEMPVNETIQLSQAIANDTTTHVAAVIVNRVLPELVVTRDLAIVDALRQRPRPFSDSHLDGLFEAAHLVRRRRSIASTHLAVLRAEISSPVPFVCLPYIFDGASPSKVVAAVAQSLDEELI